MANPLRPPGEGSHGAASRALRGILRATMVVVTAHVLIKLLGLIQTVFLNATFGATIPLDTFNVALGVIMTVFLIGEESLGPAFLPLFMERKDKGDEAGAWRFASTIVNLQVLLLAAVVVLIVVFPRLFIGIYTKWLDPKVDVGGERVSLAVKLLRIMAPGLFGISVASLTYMLLNGYKKFFWAAFGDGTLKIAVILSAALPVMLGAVFPSLGPVHPLYLGFGVLVGSYGKLFTHLPGLWAKLRLFRVRINLKDPQLRRFLVLIAPLLVGIMYANVRDIYNNYRVLSNLEEGLITINKTGKRIYDTFGNIIPYAVSIAMFPFLCELVDRNDPKALARTVTRALRVILYLFLPMAVGIVIVSVPIARVFQLGKFTPEDAYLTGVANAAYTLGLPFWAGEMILIQAFFSNRRTLAPIVIGMVWSTVSIIISHVGVVEYGFSGMLALICVAGGFALARTGKTVTLSLVLRRQVPIFSERDDLLYFVRLALTTGLVAGLIWLTKTGCEATLSGLYPVGLPGGLKHSMLMLGEVGVCGAAGAIGLVAGGLLFGMEELTLAVSWARERLARRGGPPAEPPDESPG